MHQGTWNGFHSPRYRKIEFLPWHLPHNFKNDNIWKSNGKIFLYKFKTLDEMKGDEIYGVEYKGKRSLQRKLKIQNGYSRELILTNICTYFDKIYPTQIVAPLCYMRHER